MDMISEAGTVFNNVQVSKVGKILMFFCRTITRASTLNFRMSEGISTSRVTWF